MVVSPSRLGLVAVALILAVVAACDDDAGRTPSEENDGTSSPVSSVKRPDSVPAAAAEVRETATLGAIVRSAGEEPRGESIRLLDDASCADDVMTLVTALETIYAALPCDRFWEAEQQAIFVGKQVALVLEVTSARFRILVETLAGAQAEFAPDGVWVERP